MPPPFPHHAPSNIQPTNPSTKPEFWHRLTLTEANGGSLDRCFDLPNPKRRRLIENHSSIACEALTPLQQQQCWPQQTYLSSGQNHLGGHSHLYLTQSNSEHNQESRASLTQQTYDQNRQYHEFLLSHNRNVDPHIQQQYAESNSQRQFEMVSYSENAIDVPGWHLGPELDPRQDNLKNTSQSREFQSQEFQSQIQSTILEVQSKNYNQGAEESDRPVASAAAEVCYGMVSQIFLRISYVLNLS